MITEKIFGKTSKEEEVKEYILTNGTVEVSVINFGGAVRYIKLADKNGVIQDVVLGWDDVDGYEKGSGFCGAFVGRFGNRIINSEFTLNGKTYHLTPNNGRNHLHGTFSKRVLDSHIDGDSVVMTLVSPPEEEGYPGRLDITVRYTLNDKNGLEMDYTATTDEDTVINLTNHSYFNLNGQNGRGVHDLRIQMCADFYTPVNEEVIPTGEILSVDGTPFDLREGIRVGDGLASTHPQMIMHKTYDHNFIFPKADKDMPFATVYSEDTGIKLEAFTTEPAVQLYVKNVKDVPTAEEGKKNPRQSALCLETQHYPASPNFAHFPSTVLKKGDTYHHFTEYRFSVEK